MKIWAIWFTLFIGLLHVSLLQTPALATASHLRGGGFATNPYLYRILSNAHCQILKMVLCDCFTDLILLRVTLNFLIHEKELLKPFIQP